MLFSAKRMLEGITNCALISFLALSPAFAERERMSDAHYDAKETVARAKRNQSLPRQERPEFLSAKEMHRKFPDKVKKDRPTIHTEWVVVLDTTAVAKTRQSDLFQQVAKGMGGKLLNRAATTGKKAWLLVEVPEGTNAAALKQQVAKTANVLAMSPNYKMKAFSTNDDLFWRQWSLDNDGTLANRTQIATEGADVGAIEAWEITRGSRDVVVAVIDTGVAYAHPDLAPNMWKNSAEIPNNGIDDDRNGWVDDVYGYDFVNNDGDPHDDMGHGTHVAGIIGAVGNNDMGIAGISPEVSLMALKSLDDYGDGDLFGAVRAIDYATAMGAHIINASWGFNDKSEALEVAMRAAGDAGILFVSAAGNDRQSIDWDATASWPAGFTLPNHLTVASTNMNDRISSFSSRGRERVQLAAPGEFILSTEPPLTVYISEDFDSATMPGLPEGFHAEGAFESWGTAASINGVEGNQALRADAFENSPFRSNANNILYLPTFDATGARIVQLKADYKFEGQGLGQVFVEVFFGGQWLLSDIISTESHGPHYSEVLNLIPVYSGGQHAVQIRLRWETNDTSGAEDFGFEMDNLVIFTTDYYSNQGNFSSSYQLASGTSMAAPHVAGAAALLLAQNPEMSLDELRMRLVHTGKPLDDLATTTISGKRLDVAAALTATGSLTFDDTVGGRSLQWGRLVPVNYTFFDAPSTPVTIEVLQRGAVVSTVVQGHVGDGTFMWNVPNLPPAGDYQLVLRSEDMSVTSQTFSIESVEYVEVPDPMLYQELLAFDRNGDGQLADFEVSEFSGPLVLQWEYRISDLSGLEHFSNARNLYLIGLSTPVLPDLSHWSNLRELYVESVPLEEVEGLPQSLSSLYLHQTSVKHLPELPQGLSDLSITQAPLCTLEPPPNLSFLILQDVPLESLEIPEGVYMLLLNETAITELGPIPPSLQILDLSGNPLLTLPDFENTFVSNLYLMGMNLHTVPPLPSHMDILRLDNNFLTELPQLSDNLFFLSVNENQLTSLPKLPAEISYVHARHNKLREMPEYLEGTSFSALDLAFNQIEEVSDLPPTADLDLSHNRITHIPAFNRGSMSVDLANNQLTSLPPLPLVQRVDISDNALTEMPEMPDTVIALQASGNQIEDISILADHPGLAVVDLSFNHITDPRPLLGLPNLFELDLSGNRIDSVGREAISAETFVGRVWWNTNRYFDKTSPAVWFMDRAIGLSLGLQDTDEDWPVEAVSDLEVWPAGQGQIGLSFSGGGSINFQTHNYGIYRVEGSERTLLGTTTNTSYMLPAEDAVMTLGVAPLDADGETLAPLVAVSIDGGAAHSHGYSLPWRGPRDGWMGLALVNTSAEPVSFAIAAYNSNGSSVAILDNHDDLNPGEKRTIVLNQQFAPSTWHQVSHLEVVSTGSLDGVAVIGEGSDRGTGFWLTQDTAKMGSTAFDPLNNATYEHAMYLASQLHLVNPHDLGPAQVQLTFYQGSEVLQTLDYTIPAKGKLQVDPKNLTSLEAGAISRVSWRSDLGLHALNTARYDKSFDQVLENHSRPHNGSLNGILPVSGQYLYVENPNQTETHLVLERYNHQGEFLERKALPIPAGSSKLWDIEFMLFSEAWGSDLLRNGDYLKYEATGPLHVSAKTDALYLRGVNQRRNSGWTTEGGLAAANATEVVPATSNFGQNFHLPHVTMSQEWQSELVVINGGDQETQATITFYGAAGNVLGDATYNLAPGQRLTYDGERAMEDGAFTLSKQASVARMEVTGASDAQLACWLFYYTNPLMGNTLITYPIPPRQ